LEKSGCYKIWHQQRVADIADFGGAAVRPAGHRLGQAVGAEDPPAVAAVALALLKGEGSRESGLPDFPWNNIPKRGNVYQMTTKYPK
jgi:hypothetical protein